MVFNNKGAHHIFLGIVMLFFCAVGAWSLWHWHKQGTMKENLEIMLNDFKSAADTVVTEQGDRTAVNDKVDEIRRIVEKYTIHQ